MLGPPDPERAAWLDLALLAATQGALLLVAQFSAMLDERVAWLKARRAERRGAVALAGNHGA